MSPQDSPRPRRPMNTCEGVRLAAAEFDAAARVAAAFALTVNEVVTRIVYLTKHLDQLPKPPVPRKPNTGRRRRW